MQQHVQKQVRLASAIMSMFGIGFAVATGQQIESAEQMIKRENNNRQRGVGPWFRRSAGWRQSQRRKLRRRTG